MRLERHLSQNVQSGDVALGGYLAIVMAAFVLLAFSVPMAEDWQGFDHAFDLLHHSPQKF